MASSALGASYVLSDAGASTLADMLTQGSAPVASPGFVSRLREASAANVRLLDIQAAVGVSASTR